MCLISWERIQKGNPHINFFRGRVTKGVPNGLFLRYKKLFSLLFSPCPYWLASDKLAPANVLGLRFSAPQLTVWNKNRPSLGCVFWGGLKPWKNKAGKLKICHQNSPRNSPAIFLKFTAHKKKHPKSLCRTAVSTNFSDLSRFQPIWAKKCQNSLTQLRLKNRHLDNHNGLAMQWFLVLLFSWLPSKNRATSWTDQRIASLRYYHKWQLARDFNSQKTNQTSWFVIWSELAGSGPIPKNQI